MNQGPDTGDPYQVGVTFRVEFADTDTQARVYYGNYFRYFDRARFAYWEAIGCDGAGVRLAPHRGGAEVGHDALQIGMQVSTRIGIVPSLALPDPRV